MSTSSSSTDTGSVNNQNAVTYTTVSYQTATYTTSYGITTTAVSTAPGSYLLSRLREKCVGKQGAKAQAHVAFSGKKTPLIIHCRLYRYGNYCLLPHHDGCDLSPNDNSFHAADYSSFYSAGCVKPAKRVLGTLGDCRCLSRAAQTSLPLLSNGLHTDLEQHPPSP